jgi:hypothetical protein
VKGLCRLMTYIYCLCLCVCVCGQGGGVACRCVAVSMSVPHLNFQTTLPIFRFLQSL